MSPEDGRSGLWARGRCRRRRHPPPLPQHLSDLLRQRRGAERLLQKREPPLEHLMPPDGRRRIRSEEHTSELQSRLHLVCRLLLEKKKNSYATAYMSTTSPTANSSLL